MSIRKTLLAVSFCLASLACASQLDPAPDSPQLPTDPNAPVVPPEADPEPDPEEPGPNPDPTVPPADPLPPPPPAAGYSHAFGKWEPGEFDTCTKAQHDAYQTVGPDGLVYPTWHPPVDPSGCTFGHEHGRDPRESDLYPIIGDVPFGLANEALVAFEGRMPRHEDHVGHKIEWVNNARFGGGGRVLDCDALVKIHQGSHSADAFANNVHEVAYHLICDDGTRIHFTSMVPIGVAGEFNSACAQPPIIMGSANPPDSPSSVGSRRIPTRQCIDAKIAGGPRSWVNYGHALTETWAVDPIASSKEHGRIAYLAMYSYVSGPARYFDPATGALRRTLDICYEVEDPKDGRNMGECKSVRNSGITRWDQPGSPFAGTSRVLSWNQPILTNEGGPEVIYTDPFGKGGQTEPFPGSIRQYFASINNGGRQLGGPRISANYMAPGVRAPN